MPFSKIKSANWNGQLMPIEDVKVSVLDRAFLFGDSVYEVVRVYGGKCWNLEEHMARLGDSLKNVQLHHVDPSVIKNRVVETVAASGLKEALVYVQITRGVARRQHRFPFPEDTKPNQLIWVEQFDDPHAELRERGAKVDTYPEIRWRRNDIKCTSLMANCLAATAAHEDGCDEALFTTADGYVTEGSHTSMFGVQNGEILIAPASRDVLPGITKRTVMELAEAAGVGLREHRLLADQLPDMDEFFMTGTPEEIVPIVHIDDFAIGDGKPGPVVRALQREFRKRIDEWVRKSALCLLAAICLWQASLIDTIHAVARPTATTKTLEVVLGRSWTNQPTVRGYGEVAPKTFYNGGDPTGRVENIKWKNWGQPEATGTGTAMYVPGDKPVSEGQPAKCVIVVWKLGVCQGKIAYRAVNWYFPQYKQHLKRNSYIDPCRGGYVENGQFTSMGFDR